MSVVGTITTRRHESGTVMQLAGEVDASLRPEAGSALAASLDVGGPVWVDLGRVTFIDSTGIAFLIQCRRACTESGLPLRVTHASAPVRAVVRMLGLEDVLLADGLDAA